MGVCRFSGIAMQTYFSLFVGVDVCGNIIGIGTLRSRHVDKEPVFIRGKRACESPVVRISGTIDVESQSPTTSNVDGGILTEMDKLAFRQAREGILHAREDVLPDDVLNRVAVFVFPFLGTVFLA